MTWEEYREIVQEVRGKIRETKAQLELSLASTDMLQAKGNPVIMWVLSKWRPGYAGQREG